MIFIVILTCLYWYKYVRPFDSQQSPSRRSGRSLMDSPHSCGIAPIAWLWNFRVANRNDGNATFDLDPRVWRALIHGLLLAFFPMLPSSPHDELTATVCGAVQRLTPFQKAGFLLDTALGLIENGQWVLACWFNSIRQSLMRVQIWRGGGNLPGCLLTNLRITKRGHSKGLVSQR